MGEHVVCMGAHNFHGRACYTQGKASHIHGRAHSTHVRKKMCTSTTHDIHARECNVQGKASNIYGTAHSTLGRKTPVQNFRKSTEKRILVKHIFGRAATANGC